MEGHAGNTSFSSSLGEGYGEGSRISPWAFVRRYDNGIRMPLCRIENGFEFTGGRGVDAILDMVGGNYIPAQLDLLGREGRLCFVALMQGTRVEADFGLIQRKHLTVTGSTLRSRTVDQKAAIIAALKDKVWPLWAAGKLRVFTFKQFPLVEAAGAHRLMESSQHVGKILLVP